MKQCKEIVLQQIWFQKLYCGLTFFNLGNYAPAERIEVLHPGFPNTDGGPDFFNAKIRINSIVWVGNVEIHRRASEWYQHKHHEDPAYDNTILHVILEDDCPVYNRVNGTPLFSCLMELSEREIDKAKETSHPLNSSLRCASLIHQIDPATWREWEQHLFAERMEQKAQRILQLYQTTGGDIAETLHILLMRYWGNKVNNDAFEQIARSLPVRILRKHTDQLPLLEALYFGQAGLLEDIPNDEYQAKLKEDYLFLRTKYNLTPIAPGSIRLLRLRPSAFPHRRLAQMASLRYHYPLLESEFASLEDSSSALKLFRIAPAPYWEIHSAFGQKGLCKLGKPSVLSSDMLLVNVLLPYRLFLSYIQQGRASIEEIKAMALKIKGERNRITRQFISLNFPCTSAYNSQAQIQLWDSYCTINMCYRCDIGRRTIGKSSCNEEKEKL